MTTLDLFDNTSPFDSIRQERTNGTEYWSARDVAPLLGYEHWHRFADVIDRAHQSIEDVKLAGQDHIAASVKMIEAGKGARREVEDFHLTRYGAYMVTLACDSRGKPAVSEAKSYFAVKTREAEVAAQVPALPRTYAEALRELLASVEAREAADARVAELEPQASNWRQFADADGTYDLNSVAKFLGTGRVRFMRQLRDDGILNLDNTARQDHIDCGRFVLKVGSWRRPDGRSVVSRSTRVTAKGFEWLAGKYGPPGAVVARAIEGL